MRDFFNTESDIRFLFPIDGDVVNSRDGQECADGLLIDVSVHAPSGASVLISGQRAVFCGGAYTARIKINRGTAVITAQNITDGSQASVRVYCTSDFIGKYRISSDDNILFLCDLTVNRDKYSSIFDNPYLAVYKKAHDLYGAKVHLNIFYEFDRAAAEFFSSDLPDFDLSMMTDKFKREWEENSDWLKLSFHARSEMPEKPYKYASPDKITEDFLDVRREVIRFAGEKTFSSDVTTVHWGEANPECVKALRMLGHRVLTGYFELDEYGEPSVSYYAPVPLVLHVGERDLWRDNEIGMTFGRIDRVVNIGTLDEILSDIRAIMAHPHRGGFVSIMIHEQYFYRDYVNYLPDFEARVLESARMLFEGGYRGEFIKDAANLLM